VPYGALRQLTKG